MGLFVCSECGCVENTNCATIGINNDPNFPNLRTMAMHGFGKLYEETKIKQPEHMLCSKCNTGTWHGEWEQSWPTDVELAMAEDVEGRTFTNHPLFKGSYNNEMDNYTLEQFEIENAKRKADMEKLQEPGAIEPVDMYGDLKWDYFEPYVREEPKIGRNDSCPCGSGKKYKKCCINKD